MFAPVDRWKVATQAVSIKQVGGIGAPVNRWKVATQTVSIKQLGGGAVAKGYCCACKQVESCCSGSIL